MFFKSLARSIIFLGLLSVGLLTANAFADMPEKTLRLGIISLAPPARVHQQWQGFAQYLGARTGYNVEIIVPKGFKKIKKAIEEEQVDLFYVNSHIFYRLVQGGKAEPLAQMMNLEKSITSRSVVFVRTDSGIQSSSDLKGKSIAFVSPMGAGGYVAPRARLYMSGLDVEENVQESFTKNLSSSIHKVLLGDVTAGTMCGLNFRLMSEKLNTGELKVIETSEEYPENALGVRKSMDAGIQELLRTVILKMPEDKQGQNVLHGMREMKILRFIDYDSKAEAMTRRLLEQGKFRL